MLLLELLITLTYLVNCKLILYPLKDKFSGNLGSREISSLNAKPDAADYNCSAVVSFVSYWGDPINTFPQRYKFDPHETIYDVTGTALATDWSSLVAVGPRMAARTPRFWTGSFDGSNLDNCYNWTSSAKSCLNGISNFNEKTGCQRTIHLYGLCINGTLDTTLPPTSQPSTSPTFFEGYTLFSTSSSYLGTTSNPDSLCQADGLAKGYNHGNIWAYYVGYNRTFFTDPLPIRGPGGVRIADNPQAFKLNPLQATLQGAGVTTAPTVWLGLTYNGLDFKSNSCPYKSTGQTALTTTAVTNWELSGPTATCATRSFPFLCLWDPRGATPNPSRAPSLAPTTATPTKSPTPFCSTCVPYDQTCVQTDYNNTCVGSYNLEFTVTWRQPDFSSFGVDMAVFSPSNKKTYFDLPTPNAFNSYGHWDVDDSVFGRWPQGPENIYYSYAETGHLPERGIYHVCLKSLINTPYVNYTLEVRVDNILVQTVVGTLDPTAPDDVLCTNAEGGQVVLSYGYTYSPTQSPTTSVPTISPTRSPTTAKPTKSPTTSLPTKSPTSSKPTKSPSKSPTKKPTNAPTRSPSQSPVALDHYTLRCLGTGLASTRYVGSLQNDVACNQQYSHYGGNPQVFQYFSYMGSNYYTYLTSTLGYNGNLPVYGDQGLAITAHLSDFFTGTTTFTYRSIQAATLGATSCASNNYIWIGWNGYGDGEPGYNCADWTSSAIPPAYGWIGLTNTQTNYDAGFTPTVGCNSGVANVYCIVPCYTSPTNAGTDNCHLF